MKSSPCPNRPFVEKPPMGSGRRIGGGSFQSESKSDSDPVPPPPPPSPGAAGFSVSSAGWHSELLLLLTWTNAPPPPPPPLERLMQASPCRSKSCWTARETVTAGGGRDDITSTLATTSSSTDILTFTMTVEQQKHLLQVSKSKWPRTQQHNRPTRRRNWVELLLWTFSFLRLSGGLNTEKNFTFLSLCLCLTFRTKTRMWQGRRADARGQPFLRLVVAVWPCVSRNFLFSSCFFLLSIFDLTTSGASRGGQKFHHPSPSLSVFDRNFRPKKNEQTIRQSPLSTTPIKNLVNVSPIELCKTQNNGDKKAGRCFYVRNDALTEMRWLSSSMDCVWIQRRERETVSV